MEIVTAEGFPWGVCCDVCDRALDVGSPIGWAIEGMAGDRPIEVPLCLECNDRAMGW